MTTMTLRFLLLYSKQTFLKYKRKGYHIQAEVLSSTETLFHRHRPKQSSIIQSAIAEEYFNTEYEKCCVNQHPKVDNHEMVSLSCPLYERLT